jgi:uridine phosphorylase
VLLSGSPACAEKIKALLEDPQTVGSQRGYIVYTGSYHGIPVTVASSGVGAPSLSIAVEELAVTGGQVFIRVGSCAAIDPQIGVGDIIIASGGVRDEGLSSYYAPLNYPAIAHPERPRAWLKPWGSSNCGLVQHRFVL